MNVLAIYLEFAKLSERNFGGIAVGKAASEGTTKKLNMQDFGFKNQIYLSFCDKTTKGSRKAAFD